MPPNHRKLCLLAASRGYSFVVDWGTGFFGIFDKIPEIKF